MSPILPPAAAERVHGTPLVIAIHCSGGTGRQWRPLADFLDEAATVVAPDLIGTQDIGPWCGTGPFSLADEASAIIALIDSCTGPVVPSRRSPVTSRPVPMILGMPVARYRAR